MFTKTTQKFSNFFQKTWVSRTFVVLFSTVAILSSAASCSLFSLPSSQDKPKDDSLYGVLKKDPSVGDSYGTVNAVDSDRRALDKALGIKMAQATTNNYYLLTSNKGVFRTEDGGVNWKSKSLYNLDGLKDDQLQAMKDKNDSFAGSDIEVDPKNSEVVYVAGQSSEKKGKIFRSRDGGQTFDEIYSDIDKDTTVMDVAISPNNSYELFAILSSNSLIKSSNGGDSWQKIWQFDGDMIQIGFYDVQTLFALSERDGLNFSSDKGITWKNIKLTKVESSIDQSSSGWFSGSSTKIDYVSEIEVADAPQKAVVLAAEGQLWMSKDVMSGKFEKLPLPVSSDKKVEIKAVTLHPSLGYNDFYVSIDDKLFESVDGGQSWIIKDSIGGDTKIGDINDIVLDKNSPSIVYLVLGN